MYRMLDIFFVSFHTLLIFFNLFGWMWKKTRIWNLVTLLLTGGSWFILGIFYGIGFCPLTEWHWRVLKRLGQYDLPDSYITYLIRRLTGINASEQLVETLTVLMFFVALALSISFNIAGLFRRQLKPRRAQRRRKVD
jgi:hypothetical protein